MGQSLDGNPKSTSKSKISNLKIACPIHQQILRLQVSVYNSSRVAIIDSIHKLIEEKFDLVGCDGVLVFR